MDSEGKRYEFIREKVEFPKKDFAESLGLSMSMGSQIASGILKPSRNLLNRLAVTYNVNLHWFLFVEGSSGFENGAGDGMIEAHICDGDITIFHPDETSGSGVFVVAIGNSLVVKRVDRDLAAQTIVLYRQIPPAKPAASPGRS